MGVARDEQRPWGLFLCRGADRGLDLHDLILQ